MSMKEKYTWYKPAPKASVVQLTRSAGQQRGVLIKRTASTLCQHFEINKEKATWLRCFGDWNKERLISGVDCSGDQ